MPENDSIDLEALMNEVYSQTDNPNAQVFKQPEQPEQQAQPTQNNNITPEMVRQIMEKAQQSRQTQQPAKDDKYEQMGSRIEMLERYIKENLGNVAQQTEYLKQIDTQRQDREILADLKKRSMELLNNPKYRNEYVKDVFDVEKIVPEVEKDIYDIANKEKRFFLPEEMMAIKLFPKLVEELSSMKQRESTKRALFDINEPGFTTGEKEAGNPDEARDLTMARLRALGL